MRVAVTGTSGLLGSRLARHLALAGHEVTRLVRHAPASRDELRWNPATGEADGSRLDGLDAVVHLAGASIAGRRWNDAWKREIRDSRVGPTDRLSRMLAGLSRPPRVLLSSSAIGIYGDRGDETLDEASAPGTGFLARVAVDWEGATAPAADAGIRVVLLRTGIVLSPEAGALASMLLPFRLGLGGRLGPGTQYQSWIGLDDHVAACTFALGHESLRGPVNLVAPNPVRQLEFARQLGRALGRPAVLPAPAVALRLALGEMAGPLLLESARVVPAVLEREGFTFVHRDLAGCLQALLTPRP